ncbi:MAG: hypothetical protein V4490_00310, partial [Pseudomonadota bacterium]
DTIIGNLQHEIAEAKKSFTLFQEEINEQGGQLETLSTQQKSTKKDVNELQEHKAVVSVDVQELKTAKLALEQALSAASADTKSKLDGFTALTQLLSESLKRLEALVEQHKAAFDAREAAQAKRTEQVGELSGAVQALKSQVQELTVQNTAQRDAQKQAAEARAAADARTSVLEEQHQAALAARGAAQTKSTEQVAELSSAVQALKSQVQELIAQNSAQLEAQKQATERHQAELLAEKEVRAAADARIAALEEQYRTLMLQLPERIATAVNEKISEISKAAPVRHITPELPLTPSSGSTPAAFVMSKAAVAVGQRPAGGNGGVSIIGSEPPISPNASAKYSAV